MRKYNYIVSVVMLAIAGYVFYETSGYKIGSSGQKNPAVWPMFLAGLLAVLSIALIVQTIFSKDPEMDRKDVIDWKSPGMLRVYIMLALTVGFVVLMNIVGMLLALLILLPCVELLMGCKNKVLLVAVPVALVAFCYVFFVVAMKITLPEPIWM